VVDHDPVKHEQVLFRGPRRRHESQAKLRWQLAWCGQLTVHGNWEYDGSARTAAPSKVCVEDILYACLWTIIGQQTKACIACLADLQLMCKRDYASCRIVVLRHGRSSQMHLPRTNEFSGS
jgi:hypothetical protein